MRLSGRSEENDDEDSEANSDALGASTLNPMRSSCSFKIYGIATKRYGLQALIGLSMAEPFFVGNQPTEEDKCIATLDQWMILC
jgi:hypothetical protein